MSRAWIQFLCIKLPLAALALALVAQFAASVLSDVRARRNRSDELALAVLTDPTDYRAVLLGDSITRNATARYALGADGEVANLSTHGHIGLAGEFLLLRRYLSAHSTPRHVVIAFAPDNYQIVSDARLLRYHLWHTFNAPAERSFLRSQVPDIDARERLPAIMDLQERIVEPLFSFVKERYHALTKNRVPTIPGGHIDPDERPERDLMAEPPGGSLQDMTRAALPLTLAPVVSASLKAICALSAQRGFRVDVVWPPMPGEIESALLASGALPRLEDRIRDTMRECAVNSIFDFNRIHGYTAFRRDMIHLLGEESEQQYASDLRNYLAALVRSSAGPATPSLRASHEARSQN
jgi:hypothetical protein